jgi:hypothetical protein
VFVRFYQSLLFWLDEPRLHDANLYLPSLPSQYEPDRLLAVFQGEKVRDLFMKPSSST